MGSSPCPGYHHKLNLRSKAKENTRKPPMRALQKGAHHYDGRQGLGRKPPHEGRLGCMLAESRSASVLYFPQRQALILTRGLQLRSSSPSARSRPDGGMVFRATDFRLARQRRNAVPNRIGSATAAAGDTRRKTEALNKRCSVFGAAPLNRFENQFVSNNFGYGFCRLGAGQLEVAGKGPLDFLAESGPTSSYHRETLEPRLQIWTGVVLWRNGNTVFSRNPHFYALWVALGQFIAVVPFSLRINFNGQICRLGAAERRPLSIPARTCCGAQRVQLPTAHMQFDCARLRSRGHSANVTKRSQPRPSASHNSEKMTYQLSRVIVLPTNRLCANEDRRSR
jgi:hypothetical protein